MAFPHLEPSELALWDEVGDIAERSGMAVRILIKRVRHAVDLILDVDAENSVVTFWGPSPLLSMNKGI